MCGILYISKNPFDGRKCQAALKTMFHRGPDNLSSSNIKNHFFGESVTVSGLLTGCDIIDQLKAQELGDEVWLSHRILNDSRCTLDDMTLDEISQKLGCPIVVSEDSFLDLFQEHF